MASSVPCYAISVVLCFIVFFHGYANGTVPAMYVFGDSLADVGNNDYLPLSVLKANFLPNGVDYNGGQATGRFSNGKNSADLLAEKLGLPTSPPYLNISADTNKTKAFLNGVSFASGGAGVLDSTNKGQCLTFPDQVDDFSTVHQTLVDALGSDAAMDHLSKSVFCFIIGSNDILDYTREIVFKPTPQDFVNSMISSLKDQLQRLYTLGTRKVVFVGTGPIGCCPSQRTQNSTNCDAQANQLSVLYNKGASNLLHGMKSNYSDLSYSFLDTSSALLQYLRYPAKYGFTEVKAACCGHGNLNANIPCLPNSSYCNNRKNHMFWDLFHPTEATDRLLTTTIFDGTAPLVYPINVKQLSNL